MKGLLVLALTVGTALANAETRTVALTFDDLPLARFNDGPIAEQVNANILAALKQHHAPAIGFVNETHVRGIGAGRGKAILQRWLDQGEDLGNHTFSHADLDNISVDQFREEVIQGEATIGPLLRAQGRRIRYLRFPFNHTGDTKEKHEAATAFLANRGYEVATCTIDNMDYEFARAYDFALDHKDGPASEKIRKEYLAYTGAEIDYYANLHRTVLGHEIPQVMLLHANRLNADVMNAILKLFEDRQYRFVTLQQAQSDAAYRTPDTFVTKYGPMWGYRWARELGIKVDGSLEPEPPKWVLTYGKG